MWVLCSNLKEKKKHFLQMHLYTSLHWKRKPETERERKPFSDLPAINSAVQT